MGRFMPCRIGSHMSRSRHLGWNQCSHGLSSRSSVPCGCMRDLGYPKGSASELLDGTLKLRHCTTLFTMHFPPWSLPRVGNGSGRRRDVTLGNLLDEGSNTGKRVRLTRKTRPDASSHVIPDPRHPTPRRWKILRPPSTRRRGK